MHSRHTVEARAILISSFPYSSITPVLELNPTKVAAISAAKISDASETASKSVRVGK
jgi:hypothetical protein